MSPRAPRNQAILLLVSALAAKSPSREAQRAERRESVLNQVEFEEHRTMPLQRGSALRILQTSASALSKVYRWSKMRVRQTAA